MHLSVIIPAYNEEKRLAKTLREIDEYLKTQDYESEIIVFNDASEDKTVEVVKEMMAEINPSTELRVNAEQSRSIKNLRFINKKENHGKGYGVKQSMLSARGDYRLFTDADNSTSINHVEKMWPLFEKGYDVVIGTRDSRDIKEACQAVSQPLWKRLAGDIGNIVIQLVLIWGIWDTQCGFKAFTKEAAEDIFKRCKINRWAFDVEVLALAKKLGYKIGIVPIYWINSPESKVKLKGYIQFFKELLRIKWNFILGRYDKR